MAAGRLRDAARAADPHAALAAAVAVVLVSEYLRSEVRIYPAFPVQVAVTAAGLGVAWQGRERLRLPLLLALALALQVGWVIVRLHAVFQSAEPTALYAPTGQSLLDGHYPHSEYPVAAVLLFALEAALGGARSHVVHALVMVPFQLAVVAAVWSLRTRWSAWLAAVVAVWPASAWFWEFRYDLAPTALLAVGLALAWRERWLPAGLALALGFDLKWAPGLAAVALAANLASRRAWPSIVRLAGGAALGLGLTLPFLVWSPGAVLAAYRRQGGRDITDESVWHFPLQLLGLEGRHGYQRPGFERVHAPKWADLLALAVQIVLLVALVALVSRTRVLAEAVALASLVPVVFLLTNRVFSVQYFVLLLVAWACAAALLLTEARDVARVAVAMTAATVANALILPFPIDRAYAWEAMSAIRFAIAFGLTGWLVHRVRRNVPAGEAAHA